jgi:hypothetical protein
MNTLHHSVTGQIVFYNSQAASGGLPTSKHTAAVLMKSIGSAEVQVLAVLKSIQALAMVLKSNQVLAVLKSIQVLAMVL